MTIDMESFDCGSIPLSQWVKLKSWPSAAVGNPLSVVDVFSGCGGMTLGAWEGARRIGRQLEIKGAVDLNAEAVAVYRRNFDVNSSIAHLCDVKELFPGQVGDPLSRFSKGPAIAVEHLDLLVAGPPCQGHSDLNNRSRRSDPRNDLYMAVVRAVEFLSPNVVLIENVPGAVHDSNKNVYSAAAALDEMGYTVVQSIVKMQNFGLAQGRKRHVLLGSTVHTQEVLSATLEYRSKESSRLSDVIDDLCDEFASDASPFRSAARMSKENVQRVSWLFENEEYDLPDSLRPECHRKGGHSYRSMYGRLRWDGVAQTITSGFGSMGQGRYVHPLRRRTLTCHEAARLQGFPDFFEFDDCLSVTALREMIANAVPPVFCAHVVEMLFKN